MEDDHHFCHSASPRCHSERSEESALAQVQDYPPGGAGEQQILRSAQDDKEGPG